MIVLVPAFEPDARLPHLVADLRSRAPWLSVLVIDDGSGTHYQPVFDAARREGAEVIGYPTNGGKGHALKLGFRHILDRHPDEAVVCADSDGQHSVTDILRVASRVAPGRVVLGGRRFAGNVPARSRFGNAVSRRAFALATGVTVHDTQTGLRAYPAGLLAWLLSVKGKRFEYELNTLLDAPAAGVGIEEVEIETIYLEHNSSSHFRPVVDSVRVFAPMIRYAFSSVAAFVIDAVGLIALYALTNSLLVSVVGARLVSASANFLLNRHVVFGGERGSLRRDLLRYATLAAALLASSFVWLHVLTQWGVPLVPAKLLTDVTLYIISYQVQRRFVFGRRPAAVAAAEPRVLVSR